MKVRNGWHFPDMDMHFGRYKAQYPNTKYQQHAIDAAYSYLKNFNTVIDVGANVGLHSVRFCENFTNVHAFEPVTTNFECLEANTKIFNNISLYKMGLGDKNETNKISIIEESNNCGAYSLVDFQNENNVISENIEIKRLDDFNIQPDLIKVDVQGYEDKFLLGAYQTITKYNPVLLLEVEGKKNFNKLNAILQPLNYECVQSIKKDKLWVKK
jgi:FkbM family methyltransferase